MCAVTASLLGALTASQGEPGSQARAQLTRCSALPQWPVLGVLRHVHTSGAACDQGDKWTCFA